MSAHKMVDIQWIMSFKFWKVFILELDSPILIHFHYIEKSGQNSSFASSSFMTWVKIRLDQTWKKVSVEREIVDLNSPRFSCDKLPAFLFSKLTVLWSLNHKVFKSLSLPGWEWGHFFAASFIYSFAELALVTPNAVDLSPSQFGVCGRCSFHVVIVVIESSHPSLYSSCF